VTGSHFGDIVLTGEFRAQGAETLELALRETAAGELRARLSKEDLAALGDGWHEFSFTAKGAEASFSVAGRDYKVEREGDPEFGAVRFSLVGGTLGLRNLKARLVNETPPDRILLYSSDFEMGKPAEWIRGAHVTRTTYKGSLGALSGESIGSQNFSSVVILSDLKQGLFRASPDLRVRLAVYVERASFVEARVYVKDVSGHFWWRPKETPAPGSWTVLEFGPGELTHSGAGGMKPAPGDLVTVVSVVAGKPPEQTVLYIDDFEATSKR
jgi:hypothetical protein